MLWTQLLKSFANNALTSTRMNILPKELEEANYIRMRLQGGKAIQQTPF